MLLSPFLWSEMVGILHCLVESSRCVDTRLGVNSILFRKLEVAAVSMPASCCQVGSGSIVVWHHRTGSRSSYVLHRTGSRSSYGTYLLGILTVDWFLNTEQDAFRHWLSEVHCEEPLYSIGVEGPPLFHKTPQWQMGHIHN